VSVRITGPYLDVKASQSQPHAVTLYNGRVSETHRFPAPELAEDFARQQREAHASAD
jgi:hypothetical protein